MAGVARESAGQDTQRAEDSPCAWNVFPPPACCALSWAVETDSQMLVTRSFQFVKHDPV